MKMVALALTWLLRGYLGRAGHEEGPRRHPQICCLELGLQKVPAEEGETSAMLPEEYELD